MKAAAFDYVRPATLREVCGYLADGDGEARIIAGGQSLAPLMAMRLVRPRLLVDINDVTALAGIARDGSEVVVGAATRQADAARSGIVVDDVPLLALALPFVGHDQTRNRGTVGGSLAHADPSAELPLVAQILEARLVLRTKSGARTLAAAEFFAGPMTTSLQPDECLAEI
ncbi:MAG: FAD binding domain-containing protein, partial [Alphaproteobacteria bacterium]